MKIKVLKKHINRAKKLKEKNDGMTCGQDCPIALALKEKLHQTVVVRHNFVALYCNIKKVYTRMYDISEDLTEFVKAFDRGETVHPSTFEIEPIK
jgi:hypothetical protein